MFIYKLYVYESAVYFVENNSAIGSQILSLSFNVSLLLFVCEQQLKQQRDKLKQYQKKITFHVEKERQLAKQLLKDGKKE